MSEEKCTYGDCDKDVHGDSEYCIHHKPDKNEEEARKFYKRIRQEAREPEGEIVESKKGEGYRRWVFENKLYWRGYLFPEIPIESQFTFHSSKFREELNCYKARFHGEIDFGNAVFEKYAGFIETVFKGTVRFNGVAFHEYADFMFARFEQVADFTSIMSTGKASFMSAEFMGYTDFSEAHFLGKAGYEYSKFRSEVSFAMVKFEEEVDFGDADCFRDSSFRNAAFLGELNLNKTYFQLPPKFIKGLEELDDGVTLRVRNRLHALDFLEDLVFPLIRIEIDTKENLQKHPDGKTQVYKKMEDAINRLRRIQGRDLIEVRVVTKKFTTPKAKVDGCRKQRLAYEEEGKKEEADRVFVHEMRARRETKDGRFQQFIDWLVADWTCRYGTSWQRVLGISSGFILFFAFMYWGKKISLLLSEEGFRYVIAEHTADFFGRALFQSILIFTTLGFSPRYFEEQTLLQVAAALKSILGALAVAFVVVLFARKWMRE